ncbi:MAG: ral stress protein [Haloplasmataceae bacterium]|jgi:predicted RNA-binding protein with RPS1 domain|nr:ral stress protein [Haloplasmataceae bacterium]
MAIKEGSVVRGKVTGIQPYGVFVKLNNHTNGLIHISELTDNYVKDITEFVKIGEVIRVKILQYDESNNNAKLSLKQACNYYSRFQDKKDEDNKTILETPSGFKNLKNMLDDLTKK